MNVRGVRGNVRIDTTNKSASARIAEAMSGVNAKERPRTNFATASSGARAVNGRIEGRRKALQSGKESGSEKERRCRSYNRAQNVVVGPKGSTANPHLLSGTSPRGLLFISLIGFQPGE